MKKKTAYTICDNGVTFVEMLIVLIVFSIVLLMTLPFIRSAYNAWQLGDKRAEVMQNARIALDRLAKKIDGASEIISVTPASGANGRIVVRNFDESTDTFSRNTLTSSLCWDSVSLADNISSLKFTCYETNGITETTDPKDVKMVKIELKVNDSDGLNTMIFSTRSFKRTDDVNGDLPPWDGSTSGVGCGIGMVAYAEGTVQTPRYRIWNGHSWSAEASALSVGGTIRWIVLKSCPKRNEFILGTLDASSDINIQVYNGNTKTWGNLLEVTNNAPSSAYREFDIAYESSTGDAVVVFGLNTSNNPSYRVWNGTAWSGATSFALAASGGRPNWIKLRADPDTISNEIALEVLDAGSDVNVAVWDGSTFPNANKVRVETLAPSNLYESIDIAYQPITKKAMATWLHTTNILPQYRFWTGAAWTADYSAPTITTQGRWVQVSPNGSFDTIAYGELDGSRDIRLNVLSDVSNWGSVVRVETNAEAIDRRCFDIAFEAFGNQALACWSLSANHYVQYRLWSQGSNWPTTLSGPNVGNDIELLALYPDFKTNDIMMGTITDDGDLEFTKWDGSSWGTVNKLCTNISVQLYEPFMFAYTKN